MEQWFKDNWLLVAAVGFVASVVYLVGVFWNTLLSIVTSFWARINRPRKTANTARSPDLHFVAIPAMCRVGVIRGQRPNAQIHITCYVTNASRIPVRLLTSRLLKPSVRDSLPVYVALDDTHGRSFADDDFIPPGATYRVSVAFHTTLPLDRVNKPIKIKIAFVDQLENEHKLRPITLNPTIIEPAGK